jgi:NADH-quinone oxidoreductase subunit J
MYSVLLLIGSFVALAGLYVQLDAPFLAVVQIIVYAGAIMVLFLFVVMLLNAPHGGRGAVGPAAPAAAAADRAPGRGARRC